MRRGVRKATAAAKSRSAIRPIWQRSMSQVRAQPLYALLLARLPRAKARRASKPANMPYKQKQRDLEARARRAVVVWPIEWGPAYRVVTNEGNRYVKLPPAKQRQPRKQRRA